MSEWDKETESRLQTHAPRPPPQSKVGKDTFIYLFIYFFIPLLCAWENDTWEAKVLSLFTADD